MRLRLIHPLAALMLTVLLSSAGIRAGDAIQLSDIFTGFAGASSNPSSFADINGKCFFSANDGTNGTELYVSDGFSAGTGLVKDIFPGPGSSFPSIPVNLSGVAIFTANDGSSGTELWRSDGTANGTFQLKDIRTGPGSSSPASPTVFNGAVYFSADDGINGRELWKTDGTAAGTVMVKDINPTAAGTSLAPTAKFVALGSELFFPANDGTNGVELWKTDGSNANTVLVKNINTTAGASGLVVNNELVTLAGFVYFPAMDATNGRELWRSDGSDAGTTMIANLNTAAGGSSSPDLLTVAGTFLYFRASGGGLFGVDQELYRTNGGAPTLFDLNIQSSGLIDVSSSPTFLTAVGTDLFCRANVNPGNMAGTAQGQEVVRVTAGGAVTNFNIAAGSTSSFPTNFLAVGNSLLFTANDNVNGIELFSITGGVLTLHNINTTSATASSSPLNLRAFSATLAVFTATNGSTGTELYLWNNGVVSPNPIKDLNPGADSASPGGLTLVNLSVGGPTFFFSASDGFGFELFKSDTTPSGTLRIKDLNGSANSSNPAQLTDFNGTLFFRAGEATQGQELYKSNGTPAGTVLANDIVAGSGSSFPDDLEVFNGNLYFAATDATNGTELQRTEGTTVTNAANIEAGATDSFPTGLRVANGTLYFLASTNGLFRVISFNGTTHTEVTEGVTPPFTYENPYTAGRAGTVLFFGADTIDTTAMASVGFELWRVDGTTASLVKDIATAPGVSSNPTLLTGMNNVLYFAADDGLNGRELWRSDGTSAGTTMVKDIIVGNGSSDPQNLTVVGNLLYFTASDGANGVELWKTDGTDAGTTLVKDIFPGMVGSNPHSLTALNSTLLFAASDGTTGFELWKSDGTSAGTVMVKDINPGAGSSMPPLGLNVPILPAGNAGRAVFAASNGISGTELWKTNGTADGTVQVQDINAGSGSSTPDQFTVSGNFVFFTANNGVNGIELWALALSALLDPPSITSVSTISGASGTPFNFTIGLTGSDPINVVTTDLPPGLVLSGSSISGTPTTPGTFTVTITATNTSGTATQTLKIIVTGNGVSNGIVDTDGDGFADEVETALGLDPVNPASTPFGGAPAGATVPLNVQKLTISLDFSKPQKDQITFNGLIGLKAGFTVSGQVVTLSVGGAIRSFTLDAKGNIAPKSKTESFKLSFKPSATEDFLGKYSVKFLKGTFAATLVDEGITNATLTEALRSVTVTLLLNNTVYTTPVTQVYTAQAGKKGKTSQPSGDSGGLLPTR